MDDRKIRSLIYAGLFAALCCAATLVIRFPAGLGYVNAGDAVVLLGAFILGPGWGALAAGLGSGLADLLAGYAIYAPGTVVIKALSALLAGALLNRLALRKPNPAAVLSGAAAELWMALGYFLYEDFLLGYGAAALGNVPFNLLQGIFGAAAGAALFSALCRVPFVRLWLGLDTAEKSVGGSPKGHDLTM